MSILIIFLSILLGVGAGYLCNSLFHIKSRPQVGWWLLGVALTGLIFVVSGTLAGSAVLMSPGSFLLSLLFGWLQFRYTDVITKSGLYANAV